MLKKDKHIKYFLLPCLLLLIHYLYLQGISGALYYDDFRPLSGLTNLDDTHSKLAYVLGEISGPLGRPISMFSFLLNQKDWPNHIQNILHFNILLHCINGILIFTLSNLLVRLSRPQLHHPAWPALATTALWMLSPLLISTSLIAVQRMTSLSAFFVLAGLVSYLAFFSKLTAHPKLRLSIQAVCIGFFTLLAMFSKENGILLPIFALVLEVTLLRATPECQKYRAIRLSVFSICLLIVFGYLAYSAYNSDPSYQNRSYSLVERLITQPVILFDYLRLAFIPDIFSYNPFHDNTPIYKSLHEWQALTATLSLIGIFISAIILRKKYILFSFAVLWFLSAHLLESSVIALELYFEHRNYIALIGPYLAIVLAISHTTPRYHKLSWFLFSLYISLLAFSSYQVTSIWGDQPLAGKIWFDHAKGSARATEHYAIQLLERNESEQAFLVLQQQAENCPKCIGSQVQAMQLACRFNDQDKTALYYQRGMQLSYHVKNLGSAPSSLSTIISDVKDDNCTLLSFNQLKELNTALLQHQHYGLGIGSRLALLVNLHQIAHAENNIEANINYLQQAWQTKNDRAIAGILVGRLIEAQKLDEAMSFVEQEMCAPNTLPKLNLLKQQELSHCERARGWVLQALEKHSTATNTP